MNVQTKNPIPKVELRLIDAGRIDHSTIAANTDAFEAEIMRRFRGLRPDHERVFRMAYRIQIPILGRLLALAALCPEQLDELAAFLDTLPPEIRPEEPRCSGAGPSSGQPPA